MQSALVDALGHKEAIDDRKLLVSKISIPPRFVVDHGLSTA